MRYPCDKCRRNGTCGAGCSKWREWFMEEWRRIRIVADAIKSNRRA